MSDHTTKAGKTAVIIQPCFFPWRGQYDLISRADITILLDTVQYVRHTWFNRNRILTSDGPKWITVPVKSTGDLRTKIRDIKISSHGNWRRKILFTVKQSYAGHPYIDSYYPSFEDLINSSWTYLVDIAQKSIEWGLKNLGRPVNIIRASDLKFDSRDPVDRIIGLCREVSADRYLSGPSAIDYIGNGRSFSENNIRLDWINYQYRSYPQKRKCDEPLSILDLLFNVGPEAPHYIWSQGPGLVGD